MTARPMRRWLCVAHSFAPVNRSGTHRTLGFVRHLAALGWRATVLTSEGRGAPIDDSLLDLVPDTTIVERLPSPDLVAMAKQTVRPWRNRKTTQPADEGGDGPVKTATRAATEPWHRLFLDVGTRLLQWPDARSGWTIPATLRGLRVARTFRPEVIYSTSPSVSAHLVAMLLAGRRRVPWVADFRDPWCDNPFRDVGSNGIARLDAWMERVVLHRATHIIVNTSTARARLVGRFAALAPKCTVVGNGFDADRFQGLQPRRSEGPACFILAHAGQFYGPRSPVPLLRALAVAMKRCPSLRESCLLMLIGSTHFAGRHLSAIAADHGLQANVRCVGLLGHADTLATLAGADALFLAASSGPGADLQVPAKVYEYLALGRPILAVVPQCNPAREILLDARADARCCDPESVEEMASAIIHLFTHRGFGTEGAWSRVDRYDRTHRARELAEILDLVTPGNPRSRLKLPSNPRIRCSTSDAYLPDPCS